MKTDGLRNVLKVSRKPYDFRAAARCSTSRKGSCPACATGNLWFSNVFLRSRCKSKVPRERKVLPTGSLKKVQLSKPMVCTTFLKVPRKPYDSRAAARCSTSRKGHCPACASRNHWFSNVFLCFLCDSKMARPRTVAPIGVRKKG